MSVTENLEMGAFQRSDKENFAEDMDRVFELFPRLQERRTQKAGTMSGGEQQMCAIGRALMARPKLLLLDEPSMGLAPIFVERIFETVIEVNKQGTPVLLVEQNALMALDVARARLRHGDGPNRPRRPRGRAQDERAGPQDVPGRGLGTDNHGRVRRGEQDADARASACEAMRHLECARDGVARDESERSCSHRVAAARDDDASEPRQRGLTAGPVGVRKERMTGAPGPVGVERALVGCCRELGLGERVGRACAQCLEDEAVRILRTVGERPRE